MNQPGRVYLDHAATSWPKPEAVYRAVDDYQRRCGAAPARGSSRAAIEAGRSVDLARRAVAALLGGVDARRVLFTLNGTDSLNLALHGLLRPGDHVVAGQGDHNSVLRPLRHLADRQVDVTLLPVAEQGLYSVDSLRQALRPHTRLVVLTQVSNVTGAVLPVAQMAEVARRAGALVLVDAAQAVGHVPIDVAQWPVDLLASPGHKGALGPLGTGFLYVAPGVEAHLAPHRQGGTGSHSEIDRQPEELPDKFEAGNLNAPGLCGLAAGARAVLDEGLPQVAQRERNLAQRLREGLRAVRGIRLFGDDAPDHGVGVVSLTHEAYDPQELAAMLDSSFGIETRAGLHCAPGMHRALGTLATGGTVRFSVGHGVTDEHIDHAVWALSELASFSHHG